MDNTIKRDTYLQKLIEKKENGLIKVVTGIRRCGKSFLLFTLFKEYLIESGIKQKNIIEIALDSDEHVEYRDQDELSKYIQSQIKTDDVY